MAKLENGILAVITMVLNFRAWWMVVGDLEICKKKRLGDCRATEQYFV